MASRKEKHEESWGERLVSRLIPPALILLLLIIIGEFFYAEAVEPYALEIEILDLLILVVFVADLYYKYMRLHNFGKFVRANWLEIIAVLPFYYIFRTFEAAVLFTTGLREMQGVMHETLGIGGYVSRGLGELEKLARLGKSEEFVRLLRPAARAPRFLEGAQTGIVKRLGKKGRK